MKKLLLVLAMAVTAVSLKAQAFGIHAGLNFASGQFDDGIQEDDLEGITGIRIGPVVQFPLGTVFENSYWSDLLPQKGYEVTEASNLGRLRLITSMYL